MVNKRAKNITIIMLITVASKFLGFIRDIVLAYYYGSGTITDAYYVSQTIPEFLFSLVVQAIAIGFIPVYSQIKVAGGKKEADKFTNDIIKLCTLLALVIIVIVNIFSREFVFLFASGFNDEGIALATVFVRITVFALLFRIIVSVYTAYLNANDHFILPSFNGVILDVVVILSIIVAYYFNNYALAFGIVAASLLQFICLLPFIIKKKEKTSLSLKNLFNDNTKKMFLLLLPVLLGVGANQINVLIDKTMASSFVGGISALNYAGKVGWVFENIIVLSLATVMFPSFSKSIADNNISEYKENVGISLNVVYLTMIPCTLLSIVFSKEIITFLFARGAFDQGAIENVSSAMICYSIGLLFVSINAVLTRALYSLSKVKSVSLLTALSVFVNVGMNFLLKPILGVSGLALATSISNVFISFGLLLLLRHYTGVSFINMTIFNFAKIIFGALLMAACSIIVRKYVLFNLNYIIAMIIASIFGIMVFLATEIIFKENIITTFINKIKSRNKEQLN